MPTSANISNVSAVAFTVPATRYGFSVTNESGTTILFRLGGQVSTSGDTLGIPIFNNQTRNFVFRDPLASDMQINAIRASGSSNVTLSYEIINRATDVAGQSSVSTGGGGPVTGGDVSLDPTGLSVLTATDAQTAYEQTDAALLSARNSGIEYGGVMSVDGGVGVGTTVSITAGRGSILDLSTPSAPAYSAVSWSAYNTQSPLSGTTYWYIDNTGTLQKTNTAPTAETYRTRVWLAQSVLNAGVITSVTNISTPIQNLAPAIQGLSTAIGAIRVSGSVPTSSGANLKLKITAGEFYDFGTTRWTTPNAPNSPMPPEFNSGVSDTFRYLTTAGLVTGTFTDIQVANYQVGGVVTAIPGASTRVGIHYILGLPSGNTRIVYGSAFYNNLTDAVAALAATNPYTSFPSTLNQTNSFILGAICATKSATDLSNAAQATFVTTNRFGQFGGSVAVGGVYATLGANTFTGAQTINATSLGTTPTVYESLVNTTAAAAGAQQVSPGFVLQGNGWKTNATAASQTVAFQQHVLPIQGAANPTGALLFSSNINGAGASELVRIESSAQISWGTGSGGCMTGALGAAGILIGRYDTGNPTTLNGYNAFIGNYNGAGINIQSNGSYSFASGANNLYSDRDTLLKRGGAAATLQMGEDAASTVDQTFKGPNGSGTNIQGGDLRLAPGRSTGSATPALVYLQGTTPGASGTTAQTLLDYVEVGNGHVKVINSMNFWLGNTAQVEGISPTHAMIVYDATGTPYKIPCLPV